MKKKVNRIMRDNVLSRVESYSTSKQILVCLLIFSTLISCGSDDTDNTDPTSNCTENLSLESTVWKGNGDRNGETITFVSISDYSWMASWGEKKGEFCYDGLSGNFDNTINFKVSGNEIVLNSDDQGGTGTFDRQ